MKKVKSILFVFLLALGLLLSGCSGDKNTFGNGDSTLEDEQVAAPETTPEPLAYKEVAGLDPGAAVQFSDEEQLRGYLEEAAAGDGASAAIRESVASPLASDGQGSRFYVRDDVEYILSGGELMIVRLAQENTALLSRTTVGMDWESGVAEDTVTWQGSEKLPASLYVSGDRLAVVSDRYGYTGQSGDITYKEYTSVDIYDISDPAAPALVSSLGQSGCFLDAALSGDTLTLVTEFTSTEEELLPAGYEYDVPERLTLSDVIGVPDPCASAFAVVGSYALPDQTWDLFAVAGTSFCGGLADGHVLFSSCRTAEAPSRTYTTDNVEYNETAYVDVTDVISLRSSQGTVSFDGVSTIPVKMLPGSVFAPTDEGWSLLAEANASRVSVASNGKSITGDPITGWNVLLFDDSFSLISGVSLNESIVPTVCALSGKGALLSDESGNGCFIPYDGSEAVVWNGETFDDGYFLEIPTGLVFLGSNENGAFISVVTESGENQGTISLGEDFSALLEKQSSWSFDESTNRLMLCADDSLCVYLLENGQFSFEKDLYTNDWGWNGFMTRVDNVFYLTDSKEVFVLSAEDLSELACIGF